MALPLGAGILVAILGLCLARPAPASGPPIAVLTMMSAQQAIGGSASPSEAGALVPLAREEALKVASSPTTVPPVHSGHQTRALIGYVLIGLVVVGWTMVFVVRARRRRAWRAVTPFSMAQVASTATARPMPASREVGRSREVGWHSDPDHMSEQTYWDGKSWTARRRWSGESWVDIPQGPSA
jgi:hypothetical protein